MTSSMSEHFNGNPAHPELFNIWKEDGNRFEGKPDVTHGTFVLRCPKIGGKKFSFSFSTNDRDDDGEYWIELSQGAFHALNSSCGVESRFKIRLIYDGEVDAYRSDGVRLDHLLTLGSLENDKLEMAFADGLLDDGEFREFSQQTLTSEEVETFTAYVRAFEEAMFGLGRNTAELERFKALAEEKKSKKGCLGILVLPLLATAGAVAWLLA